MYHVNMNVNFKVENEPWIKIEITIDVDASVKIQNNFVCAKGIIFGILLDVFA